jgi:DNA-binding transcriptional LysR family regulator
MMELISSLKTFLRVSETGSFSAVATELGVAQSIVSRQLSALRSIWERVLFTATHARSP